MPNIYDRLKGVAGLLISQGLMDPFDVEKSFSMFYYDTSGNPVPVLLKFLLNIADPSHILYGTDYPFTPKETVLDNLRTLEEYLENEPALSPYKHMILHDNAIRLFNLKI